MKKYARSLKHHIEISNENLFITLSLNISMENENIPEDKLACDFLFRPEVKDVFALLDCALKNGQYIQNYSSQE